MLRKWKSTSEEVNVEAPLETSGIVGEHDSQLTLIVNKTELSPGTDAVMVTGPAVKEAV